MLSCCVAAKTLWSTRAGSSAARRTSAKLFRKLPIGSVAMCDLSTMLACANLSLAKFCALLGTASPESHCSVARMARHALVINVAPSMGIGYARPNDA